MPDNVMEVKIVKITLTPLGQGEQQNHRTIVISPDNLSVNVGRASKNTNKGLLAAPDNAWFDYPILSRTHAKFTASRNHRQIYLQDCGSTHGTYIDRRRLEVGVEFAVPDAAVITFGQRVTSGAFTFPAKEFRVHSKWESPSEIQDSYPATIMRAQGQVHTTSNPRPAFTNDFEHSSEPSREGSIQVVESYRHTFSVPSSDDEIDSEYEEDELQIMSSVHGDEEEVSAATTPDGQAVEKAYSKIEGHTEGSTARVETGETRGLNLKGPTLQELLTKTAKDGTSQENAINLDGVRADIIDVDTESEDDGPEVLPFYESSRKVQSNHHEDSIVPDTQAKGPDADEVRGHESTSTRAESTTEATDDFDSEDDDGFDYDREFFADDNLEHLPAYIPPNTETPASSKPKVTFQVGNGKPYYTTLTPPFDEFRPTRLGHLSVSDAIDVSQHAQPSSAWVRRAPSPSDAALARKASDPKMSLSRDIFDNFPEPELPATAKTTHSHSTEHGKDISTLREECSEPFSWPELQNPEPRLYDQGPFCSQPKVVVPVPRSPKPDNGENQTKKATVIWADPCEDNDDSILNANRLARTGRQASKITIPSLVENYLAENPRSVKRKYGGMSGSNNTEAASKSPRPISPVTHTSGYKRTFEEANPFEDDVLESKLQPRWDPTDLIENTTQRHGGSNDLDTPLPDAQPRESVFQTPTAPMSQDSVAEPALGSVPVTTSDQGHDAEGPACKKARTSSSSSGGIGKFVMGVGFGLLGAAAAFVATIPASVYEEALREFGDAA